MTMQLFFSNPESFQRLRAGPLADDLDGFAAWMAAEGFAPSTSREKLRLASDLSLWLDGCGLALDALDERRVEEFLQALDPQRRRHSDAATGRQLLAHLRQQGRVPAAPAVPHPEGRIEQIQRAYECFLVNERGVGRSTACGYVSLVGTFLAERFGAEDIELKSLSARDANQFILRHAQDWSHSYCRQAVTALRGFLRRLYQRGEIPADLAAAVLPVRNWRFSEPPKSLPAEQVEAILSCCNRSTALGRRDHAILLLLARLGLRAGEVAALTLEDFDWSEGVVSVPGKGPRRELLPLPQEVGEALAAYLQDGRPNCASRRVFIRRNAPHHGFRSASTVCNVVRQALARAQLDPPRKGAHLLRHSLATGMLRNGASLAEIGQILRHSLPSTTQVYAAVDLEALRFVAPVWPGGVT